MTYIKHFMYKCTTRLLSLIVTFNTVGMPGNCEAIMAPPPPSNNFPTMIVVATTTIAAAATTTYKHLQRKKIENAARKNSPPYISSMCRSG